MDTVTARVPDVLRAVDGLAAAEAAAVLQQALSQLEAQQRQSAPAEPDALSRTPTPVETPAVVAEAAPAPVVPAAVAQAPVAPTPAAPNSDSEATVRQVPKSRAGLIIGAAIAAALLIVGGTALYLTLDPSDAGGADAPVVAAPPPTAPKVRTRPHPPPVVEADDETPQPAPKVRTRPHPAAAAADDDVALPPIPAPAPRAKAQASPRPVAAPPARTEPQAAPKAAAPAKAAPAADEPFVDDDLQQLRNQR
jgi:hypothetical protein